MVKKSARGAFTLTELIATMVIGSIILLSITVLFIAQHRFKESISNDVEAATEARIAMDHMTRLMRFGKVDTTYYNSEVDMSVPKDGKLDYNDITIFETAWAAGDMSADINQDGQVDDLDRQAFINKFGAAEIVAGVNYLGGMIEGGHISYITQDTVVSYIRNQNNEIEFTLGTDPPMVIARDITMFESQAVNSVIVVKLKSVKESSFLFLRTFILRLIPPIAPSLLR